MAPRPGAALLAANYRAKFMHANNAANEQAPLSGMRGCILVRCLGAGDNDASRIYYRLIRAQMNMHPK